jgi:UDP-N-acetylglucosamine--N-acetylmuramyl-(pentapeptide) pyrophosphoryl-undecaprenol N-acetylglucosamine transferase
VALAARLRGIPIVLFLPDIQPGWAIRTLAPLAQRIAATSATSQRFLPAGKVLETGYPVREEIWAIEKETARQRLGLSPELPTLLVLGGSRGARRLNQAIADCLEELLASSQVLHISGRADAPWLRERAATLKGHQARRYVLHPYLHSDFPYSLAAADLALSRAGASVMGEFPAAALPSILVPYPHAGSHQEANARLLVQAGAALKLENGQLAGLLPLVRELLADKGRLTQMAEAARGLRRERAATDIARLLVEVGGSRA